MDKNQGPWKDFKNWLLKDKQTGKKPGKYQYMIIVLCIGAAFMLAGNILMKKQPDGVDLQAMKTSPSNSANVPAFGSNDNSGNSEMAAYEKEYETQLKDALDVMLGVNDVQVIVNLDGTEQKVLEQNTVTKNQTTNETDSNGGKRTVEDSSIDQQMVIIRNGDNESPVVVSTKKPTIRGVLVVAKGADDIEVKKAIVDAVTRALGVPSYRVAVEPGK